MIADEWVEFAVRDVYVDVRSFRSAGGILCSGPGTGSLLDGAIIGGSGSE